MVNHVFLGRRQHHDYQVNDVLIDKGASVTGQSMPLIGGDSSVSVSGGKGPEVSILSAVWNEATNIAEMITSVQAQDLRNWELLFVDDGSTDNTVAIINGYASQDARIRLVSHGRRIGKVACFNVAFAAGEGDIIVLLAGDDRLPAGSLDARYRALSSIPKDKPTVAYFKIRLFWDDARFADMVLPKGVAGSRSGGSLTMNMVLAKKLFPIDDTLVSEDTWLGFGSEHLATMVIERPEVVVEGRIHRGNSLPRDACYSIMTELIHQRAQAYKRLAEAEHVPFDRGTRQKLANAWAAEQLRHDGRLVSLAMFRPLPLTERAALLSRAHPILYALRMRFYRFFTGRRGK